MIRAEIPRNPINLILDNNKMKQDGLVFNVRPPMSPTNLLFG